MLDETVSVAEGIKTRSIPLHLSGSSIDPEFISGGALSQDVHDIWSASSRSRRPTTGRLAEAVWRSQVASRLIRFDDPESESNGRVSNKRENTPDATCL